MSLLAFQTVSQILPCPEYLQTCAEEMKCGQSKVFICDQIGPADVLYSDCCESIFVLLELPLNVFPYNDAFDLNVCFIK